MQSSNAKRVSKKKGPHAEQQPEDKTHLVQLQHLQAHTVGGTSCVSLYQSEQLSCTTWCKARCSSAAVDCVRLAGSRLAVRKYDDVITIQRGAHQVTRVLKHRLLQRSMVTTGGQAQMVRAIMHTCMHACTDDIHQAGHTYKV